MKCSKYTLEKTWWRICILQFQIILFLQSFICFHSSVGFGVLVQTEDTSASPELHGGNFLNVLNINTRKVSHIYTEGWNYEDVGVLPLHYFKPLWFWMNSFTLKAQTWWKVERKKWRFRGFNSSRFCIWTNNSSISILNVLRGFECLPAKVLQNLHRACVFSCNFWWHFLQCQHCNQSKVCNGYISLFSFLFFFLESCLDHYSNKIALLFHRNVCPYYLLPKYSTCYKGSCV